MCSEQILIFIHSDKTGMFLDWVLAFIIWEVSLCLEALMKIVPTAFFRQLQIHHKLFFFVL